MLSNDATFFLEMIMKFHVFNNMEVLSMHARHLEMYLLYSLSRYKVKEKWIASRHGAGIFIHFCDN